MENRRKNLRFECLFKLKSMVNDQDNFIPAMAKDVSVGGACVLSDVPLPDHPVILRFFSLDRSRSLDIKSLVVWSKELKDEFGKYQSGVRFFEMEGETSQLFNNLLEEIRY